MKGELYLQLRLYYFSYCTFFRVKEFQIADRIYGTPVLEWTALNLLYIHQVWLMKKMPLVLRFILISYMVML